MKIMVLSSHTSSLFWFRLDMMKEFVNLDHQVIAVGPESESEWKDKFNLYNIDYKRIKVERNGINPLSDIRTLIALFKLIKHEKPDKIFAYQAKTVVYGSIAAKLNGIREVYLMFAGLGSIFRGTGFRSNLLKSLMKIQYWMACKFSQKVFFQNNDDLKEFIINRLVDRGKTVIINGSGVNLDIFFPTPLPDQPALLFIGRLIKDKGILEYLEACKFIKNKFPNVRCLLVGPYDSNPSSLSRRELEPYVHNGTVEYYGEQSDVRPFISLCNIFVLPSHHEGMPKTILEAMAMGRAIITCNAPGCKETVIDGVNGYLIEVNNIQILIEKLEILISQPDLTQKMGEKSVSIARDKFDVKKVNQVILESMNLK